MTPEMQAAIERLERLLRDSGEWVCEIDPGDRDALRLVLAAVTPREGAEKLVGSAIDWCGQGWMRSVSGDATGLYAIVYGRTEAEALARARAVAQVAAREVSRG